VKIGQQGKGVAKTLYDSLFESLKSKGFRRAYAGIVLPNAASVALHKSASFEVIGVFPEAGFKFERWHDVSWWHGGSGVRLASC
jgi:phosphinothricin acetyltransferase